MNSLMLLPTSKIEPKMLFGIDNNWNIGIFYHRQQAETGHHSGNSMSSSLEIQIYLVLALTRGIFLLFDEIKNPHHLL